MKDITYRCDLCRASCAENVADGFLIGLYWSDAPNKHGWIEYDVRKTEHHICTTCLKSLQTIGQNSKPAVNK